MRSIRYIIPSIFSLLALFSAYSAVLLSLEKQFINGAYFIIAAMIFDSLDGRVARMLNATTKFGASLDSLVDMMAYGISPAIMMYCWSLHVFDRIGYLIAFLMCACAGLRLARFNIMIDTQDKRFFRGLSSTMAGGFVVSFILCCTQFNLHGQIVDIAAIFITLLSAALMVSNFKFYSFKAIDKYKKLINGALITIIVVMTALIPIYKGWMVFGFLAGYIGINLLLQPIYKRMQHLNG